MKGRKLFIGILASLLLVVLLFLLFRNFILHKAIDKISQKLDKDYGMQLLIGKSNFSGLITIEMNGISVKPQDGDTLPTVDSLSATPSFSSLLLLTVKMKALAMKNGFVQLVCKDGKCNYSSLLSKKSSADT